MKSLYTYKVQPKFKMVGDRVASHPLTGYIAIYVSYAKTRMTLPLSPFTQEIVNHCRLSLWQIPSAAVDRIVTFETLCREYNIEPTVNLFRFWFHILPMNTDWNHVVIAGRAGFLLFEHLADCAHSWRDLFFFVEFNHLDPIDPARPPLEGWASLDTLKSRATIVPPSTCPPTKRKRMMYSLPSTVTVL